ncbi:telomere binding protein [Ceratobasidium sp. 428]|nr:telomere binding protein [Ceratobasidium sp. 428]
MVKRELNASLRVPRDLPRCASVFPAQYIAHAAPPAPLHMLTMTTITQEIITCIRQPAPSLTKLEALLATPPISLRTTVPKSTGSIHLASPPSAHQISTLYSLAVNPHYPSAIQLRFTPAGKLHASRNAPAFLHVLASDAAKLTLAASTQPMSQNRHSSLNGAPKETEAEAGVLVGALDLALIVLGTAIELNDGRFFALKRSELLVGIGQWASTVFEALDNEKKTPGTRRSGGRKD